MQLNELQPEKQQQKAIVKAAAYKTRRAWWQAWGEVLLGLLRGDLLDRASKWAFANGPEEVDERDIRRLAKLDAPSLSMLMNHEDLIAKLAEPSWAEVTHKLPLKALEVLTLPHLEKLAPQLLDKQVNNLIGGDRCDENVMQVLERAVVMPRRRKRGDKAPLTEEMLERACQDGDPQAVGIALNESNPVDLWVYRPEGVALEKITAAASHVMQHDVLRILAYKLVEEQEFFAGWIGHFILREQLLEVLRVLSAGQMRSVVMSSLKPPQMAWFLEMLMDDDFRLGIEPRSRVPEPTGRPFVDTMLKLQQMHPLIQTAMKMKGGFDRFVEEYRVVPTTAAQIRLEEELTGAGWSEEVESFLAGPIEKWPDEINRLSAGARTLLMTDDAYVKSLLEKNGELLKSPVINDGMWDLLLGNANEQQIRALAEVCSRSMLQQLKKGTQLLWEQDALMERQLRGLHLLAAVQDDQLRDSLLLNLDQLKRGHFHVIVPLLPRMDRLKALAELAHRFKGNREEIQLWLGMDMDDLLRKGLEHLREVLDDVRAQVRACMKERDFAAAEDALISLETDLEMIWPLVEHFPRRTQFIRALKERAERRRKRLDLQEILYGDAALATEEKWRQAVAIATREELRQLQKKAEESDLPFARELVKGVT